MKRKEKCHSGDKWMRYQRCTPCKTRCFSRLVVSKSNVAFAYDIVKMMVTHDCHALLEKKTIVTDATSLVIRAHPCCIVT